MPRSQFTNYKRKVVFILERQHAWPSDKATQWIADNPKHTHYMWVSFMSGHKVAEFITTYPKRKED